MQLRMSECDGEGRNQQAVHAPTTSRANTSKLR